MIKACLFDMGNVLVSFSHDKMLKQMAAVCDCKPEFLREWLFDSDRFLDYERGNISDEELHQLIEQATNKKIDWKELTWAASDIFTENHQIAPLIQSLHDSGMKLILLSNTNRLHFEFIKEQFSILDHFDDYVLSYQACLLKPEREIYELAAQRAGVLPEECFFTDDLQENILGAREAGLHAEQFLNADQISKTIDQLLQAQSSC